MAHIPFGYRIVGGKAEIDPEQAGRYRQFIACYLAGVSIREACIRAGIDVSYGTARRMLHSPVYGGNDYYPAILDEETLRLIREEAGKRTTPATTRAADPLPVEHSFTINEPDRDLVRRLGLKERVSYLYTLIEPSPRGHRTMSRDDIDYIRRTEGGETCQ